MMYSVIKNDEQYKRYLKRFESLFNAEEGTDLFREFELLGLLLDKYETETVEIPSSDPIDTLKFIMEQRNMRPIDLGKILKSPSRASEILNKKRKLSLNHIRLLNTYFKIPSHILIQDYALNV